MLKPSTPLQLQSLSDVSKEEVMLHSTELIFIALGKGKGLL